MTGKICVRLNPDTPPTGTDLSVVNAARRSFNTRSDWEYKTTSVTNYDVGSGEEICTYVDKTKPTLKDKDKRLIEFLARGMTADDFEGFLCEVMASEYLISETELKQRLWQWRNTPTHDTPFNHTFISFEVKAPIFVRAQLVKHEYLIMSEFSRRYITDGIEFYEPDYWRKAAPNKKQGSLEEEQYTKVTEWQRNGYAFDAFKQLLEDEVAPEQARMVLPQSTMTEWTWSGTLGAFAKMCQLRLHPEAQYEARLVAQEVYKYLKEQWPVSAPALVEGVK
jgi:thymidylate synthase (FAD)